MIGLEELKEFSRYQKGNIRLNGLIIHYNDPLSFYNEYKDIFINRIYHFKPANEDPRIFDVGGYIGLSTMYFKLIFPKARIKVFEPDPEIFNILKLNIESNHFNGIELINAGAGKEEDKIRFFPDGADGGNIFIQKQDKIIEVNMVKLSNYIDGPIDMLKMNIEGMEGEVFEEIEHRLHLVKEIIFEYHAFHNLSQHLGKILTILDRSRFRYLVANVPSIPNLVPGNLTGDYKSFNLVYARNATEGLDDC